MPKDFDEFLKAQESESLLTKEEKQLKETRKEAPEPEGFEDVFKRFIDEVNEQRNEPIPDDQLHLLREPLLDLAKKAEGLGYNTELHVSNQFEPSQEPSEQQSVVNPMQQIAVLRYDKQDKKADVELSDEHKAAQEYGGAGNAVGTVRFKGTTMALTARPDFISHMSTDAVGAALNEMNDKMNTTQLDQLKAQAEDRPYAGVSDTTPDKEDKQEAAAEGPGATPKPRPPGTSTSGSG